MQVHGLLAVALAGCMLQNPSPVHAPTQAAETRAVFPMPTGGITIAAQGPEGGPSLADVLRDFAEAAGQNISLDEPTRQALELNPAGLLRSTQVPAASLYSYVETLLFERGFVVSELRASEPRLLGIYPIPQGGQVTFGPARLVPEDELELYRDHPALLVMTVLHLPSIDVRQLGNSLRALSMNPASAAIVPLGATSTLLMRGPGREVAELAWLLKRSDADARAEAEARSAAEAVERVSEEKPAGDR